MSAPIATPASDIHSAVHARWLWCCLCLFLLRVLAQPLSLMTDGAYLPDFATWHSGAVPYVVLLIAQILILVVFVYLAWSVSAARVTPRPLVGHFHVRYGS
jgi:hypothetical protein